MYSTYCEYRDRPAGPCVRGKCVACGLVPRAHNGTQVHACTGRVWAADGWPAKPRAIAVAGQAPCPNRRQPRGLDHARNKRHPSFVQSHRIPPRADALNGLEMCLRRISISRGILAIKHPLSSQNPSHLAIDNRPRCTSAVLPLGMQDLFGGCRLSRSTRTGVRCGDEQATRYELRLHG